MHLGTTHVSSPNARKDEFWHLQLHRAFIRGIELKKNGENYRDENEWLEREGMDGFHISN
jgi:hypothetical protein